MKYRFIPLMFMLFSATVSSAFASSSKKKIVTTPTLEAGLMNWKPAMPLHHGRPHTGDGFYAKAGASGSSSAGFILGPVASIQYLKKINDMFGVFVGVEYAQQKFKAATPLIDFVYGQTQIPVIITYFPTEYIYLGVGAKYSYLANASVNGQNIGLSNNKTFNRGGVAYIIDASFGWSIKSPRLGVQYAYQTGASQVGQNNGFIEVTLRVPFATKK
jgi:hypothetical protein